MTSRVLVVGEALTDIVIAADGAESEHPGGSPMNVAVGLARLGVPTVFHTSIGRDARGEQIAAHLGASGVEVTATSTTDAPTSTAQATLGADGAATYVFDLAWNPAAGVRAGEGTVAVHTGSLGAILDPGAGEVLAILSEARNRCTLSFDPNARPQLMGDPVVVRERVEELVSLCDVVKSSDEDIEWLYPGSDPREVAAGWAALGPAVVVVTFGGSGAWATSAGHAVDFAAPTVTVADTIGAGDSFMAGLIATLDDRGLLGAERRDALRTLDVDTLRDIVAFAAGCAAITVTRAGANPPTRADLG